jgi:hypothetical protein
VAEEGGQKEAENGVNRQRFGQPLEQLGDTPQTGNIHFHSQRDKRIDSVECSRLKGGYRHRGRKSIQVDQGHMGVHGRVQSQEVLRVQ